MSDDKLGRLAKGSLISRLFGSGKQPLRLVAVPRDHVLGDRARGDALLAGRLRVGSAELGLAEIDFSAVGARGALARELQIGRASCRERESVEVGAGTVIQTRA